MIKQFKQLPAGAQLFFGGASLFLLYKTYQILAGSEVRRVEGVNESKQTQAQKLFAFNNNPTYTSEQGKEFAQSLAEILQYGIGGNQAEFETIMLRMRNNADVKKLIGLYGKKMNYLYGVPTGLKTLLQTLENEEPEKKNKVNIDWKAKGINFKI